MSKVVLCGRRNTFATFSNDALHFSWQGQHFIHLRCHFAWQAHHFRCVVLRAFCDLQCLRCARWTFMSFCVAGVALCDIPTCFMTCQKSFVWQAQYFCYVFQRERCAKWWRGPISVAGVAFCEHRRKLRTT